MNDVIQKFHDIVISATEKRERVNHVNIYQDYLVATDGQMLVYVHQSHIPNHGIDCQCIGSAIIEKNNLLTIYNPIALSGIKFTDLWDFFEPYKKEYFEHRKSYITCDECNGDGCIECSECETELDCKNCLGKGRIETVDHAGFYEPKFRSLLIKVGKYYVDAALVYRALFVLKLIKSDLDIEIFSSVTGEAVRLWCDGFIAIIMRLKIHESDLKNYKVIGELRTCSHIGNEISEDVL